jgi:hypothetical protein
MITDTQIQSWIEKFGTVTSFTFVVYGDMKEEELATIIKGLVFHLNCKNFQLETAVFSEHINEEKAVAWNTYQGTSISFVFAGDVLDIENEVIEVVQDGLKYLRYKNDYMGNDRSCSYV